MIEDTAGCQVCWGGHGAGLHTCVKLDPTLMFDDATGCQVVAEQLARGGSASQAAAALVRGGRGRRGRDRAFPFFFFENPSLNFLPLAFPLPPPPPFR